MVSGRKPGFEHSDETIEKIRQSRLGRKHSLETKAKISASTSASQSTPIERLCKFRLQELMDTYPQHKQFFKDHRKELLVALQDVKSEQELDFISKYRESEDIGRYINNQWPYSSSSFRAHEDVLIELIDRSKHWKTLH